MRNYTAPNNGIEAWRECWLKWGRNNGAEPRSRLAKELRYIRYKYGTTEARRYRDNLHWLGSYPVKTPGK